MESQNLHGLLWLVLAAIELSQSINNRNDSTSRQTLATLNTLRPHRHARSTEDVGHEREELELEEKAEENLGCILKKLATVI